MESFLIDFRTFQLVTVWFCADVIMYQVQDESGLHEHVPILLMPT